MAPVTPQGPEKGDPGPFAIYCISFISCACPHPTHTPRCLDLCPSWALLGGSPGVPRWCQAIQVSLRSWKCVLWGSGAPHCAVPKHKASGTHPVQGLGQVPHPWPPSPPPSLACPLSGPGTDQSPWWFFFLLSPLPHPAESAFSRRVEGKAQNHFEETNSSSQNSSGELVSGMPRDRRPVRPGSLWSVLG